MNARDRAHVTVRPAVAADSSFILDAWILSFRSSHFSGPIAMHRFREVYRVEISDLILRPQCTVRVACNATNAAQIFGFICFELGRKWPVIHYLYVKEGCRKFGIGRLLADDAQIRLDRSFFYTYRTPVAHDLTRRGGKFHRGKFQPSIAREELRALQEHHVHSS